MSVDDQPIVEAVPPSRQDLGLAKALNCDASLVEEVWRQLKLDLGEDPNSLINLKSIVSQYQSLINSTERIHSRIGSLPSDELVRLKLEGNVLELRLDQLREELVALRDHRKSVIDRNPSSGGQDARADMLAEFVAVVFERTNRSVTFGHDEGEPTTDFGRSVREVLTICDNTRFQEERKDHRTNTFITNWRQPAHKAFLKRKE